MKNRRECKLARQLEMLRSHFLYSLYYPPVFVERKLHLNLIGYWPMLEENLRELTLKVLLCSSESPFQFLLSGYLQLGGNKLDLNRFDFSPIVLETFPVYKLIKRIQKQQFLYQNFLPDRLLSVRNRHFLNGYESQPIFLDRLLACELIMPLHN